MQVGELSTQQQALVQAEMARALRYLLGRYASFTTSRWDQHLRWEFGDEVAEPMIDSLRELMGTPPEPVPAGAEP